MSEYDQKMRAHRAREEAEALSRRDEAVAQIHASRGIADSEEVGRVTGDTRIPDAQKAYEEAGRDLSGATAGLTDSRGNMAQNNEVAEAGGVGVDASNSQTGSTEPADTADEAGSVTIPDDYENLPFKDRAALAAQLTKSGQMPRNGDQANEIISKELARRAGE